MIKLFERDTKIQLKLIKENAFNIQYISNPSLEVQLEAIRKNKNNIKYIIRYLNLNEEKDLLDLHIELLEALLHEEFLNNTTIKYLSQNGNKEIKQLIIEYKLNNKGAE